MRTRRTAIGAAVLATIVGVGALGTGLASGSGGQQLPEACQRHPGERVQIDTAKLIIEYNATDGDLGVHGAFDDHCWSELCVLDPNGKPIAVFDPKGKLDKLTMAGVFFESREPPLDEFGFDELATQFPEGSYKVRARSFDGTVLVGAATFTHDMPASPTIVAPDLAEDPEQPGPPVSRQNLSVDWDPVTKTVDGRPITISGYELIVTKEDHEDPHGFSRPIYDVHVRPGVTALSVPAQFLQPNSVYEIEVLALEESGNQTISVGFFTT
jgi:hypothetical protein